MGPGCVDAAMIDLSRGAARGEEEPPMKTYRAGRPMLPGRHAHPFRGATRAGTQCPMLAKDGSSTRYT